MISPLFRNVILFIIFFFITTPISAQENEILTDILTLELSFGDKDLSDEYLLAQPWKVAVTDNGNIVVCDEVCLKVFDKNGKPLRIVDRKGQGPGEFETLGNLYISPRGFLSVFASRNYHNIFYLNFNYL